MDLSRRQAVGGALGIGAGGLLAWAWAAGQPLVGLVTHGPGAATAFGSVRVVGVATGRRPDTAGPGGHPGGHPGEGPWTSVLRLDLEVHNGTAQELLFSPGQFRLRVPSGATVTPFDTERAAGPLPARRTTRTWVSYLAPADLTEADLEFREAGSARALLLPLPAGALIGAAGHHGSGS